MVVHFFWLDEWGLLSYKAVIFDILWEKYNVEYHVERQSSCLTSLFVRLAMNGLNFMEICHKNVFPLSSQKSERIVA